MAQEPFGDRTERATPRRRQEARRRGQVARSTELTGAVALLAAVAGLVVFGPAILENLALLMRGSLAAGAPQVSTAADAYTVFQQVGVRLLWTVAPLLASLMAIGLLVNVLQVGFLFTGQPLSPRLSKLNPIEGFGRIFGRRGWVELAKALAKIAAVGLVTYFTLRADLESLVPLMGAEGGTLLEEIGAATVRIGLRAGAILLVLAGLDYAYQRWEYERSLRMSRKEVEEEQKQTEGDPHVKARVRAMQRAASRQRMMDEVAKADVVVTNPVHVAVALRYDRAKMDAPVVVARGMRRIAERIKEIAREHRIPVIEDPPLARALHRSTQIGDAIPEALYQVVAQLLAQIWRLPGAAGHPNPAAASAGRMGPDPASRPPMGPSADDPGSAHAEGER